MLDQWIPDKDWVQQITNVIELQRTGVDGQYTTTINQDHWRAILVLDATVASFAISLAFSGLTPDLRSTQLYECT
jgi:hypothetical protein